jgi:DNA-binding protein HU-beta
MTKNELAKNVKAALELHSIDEAAKVFDKVTEVIAAAVKSGEDVTLGNLGKFVVVERAARKGRNLQTGEVIDIPACKVVKFKPSAAAKKMVNE